MTDENWIAASDADIARTINNLGVIGAISEAIEKIAEFSAVNVLHRAGIQSPSCNPLEVIDHNNRLLKTALESLSKSIESVRHDGTTGGNASH